MDTLVEWSNLLESFILEGPMQVNLNTSVSFIHKQLLDGCEKGVFDKILWRWIGSEEVQEPISHLQIDNHKEEERKTSDMHMMVSHY